MNESTLTQLKIVVERAVRPVRASFARKRKVREELLAHVSGVFESVARRDRESNRSQPSPRHRVRRGKWSRSD